MKEGSISFLYIIGRRYGETSVKRAPVLEGLSIGLYSDGVYEWGLSENRSLRTVTLVSGPCPHAGEDDEMGSDIGIDIALIKTMIALERWNECLPLYVSDWQAALRAGVLDPVLLF